ncbi:hypothetical protein WDJ50_18310 (plasmid) [Deinococcus sp. VB142]|uniref:Uncharacterized protein n=1 Tax=Deinococcus sp. VB142 TaxID=3112952 RepID=A0AAU6Q8Y4_9DEIO
MSPGDFRYVFRSGLRLQVTPEGDCREGTFTAKGQGVGLSPLDAVQITFDGVPIFYGEVRVGGNPYDVDGHQFTLRSLSLRLKEVTIPEGWSSPQQNAGETVRSLIAAVLPQVGGAFSIGQINLPFDCRAIVNAQQQNPYALLEQIASDGAGLGVKVRFGVNANKEFFCVPAREDVASLSSDMLTAQARWTAPVAEAPCTAVLWYVAKKPDGSWLTHLSQAPEVGVYGLRVKAVSLTNDKGLWSTVDSTLSYRHAVGDGQWEAFAPASALVPSELTDGKVALTTSVSTAKLNLSVTATFAERIDRVVVAAKGERYLAAQNKSVELPIEAYALGITGSTWEPNGSAHYLAVPASQVNVTYYSFFAPPEQEGDTTTLKFGELRGEVLDRNLLDQLAKYHYNVPATAPADLELRGFYSGQAGNVTLNGWQSPVDAWEYRLSAARGMCTGILAGQRDDPSKLAQAELIKARDQKAVITAITSAT